MKIRTLTRFTAGALGSAFLMGNLFAADAAPAESPNPRQEHRQMLNQQQKRRYEIMVLIQAYRLLPQDQQTSVKAAIVERLKADCIDHRARLEKMIARTEKTLADLKKELEEPVDTKVESELERLLNAPIGGMGPRGWLRDGAPMGMAPRAKAEFRRDPRIQEMRRPNAEMRPQRPQRPKRPIIDPVLTLPEETVSQK